LYPTTPIQHAERERESATIRELHI